MSNQKTGKNNPRWKGNNVGYKYLHIWVRKYLPEPSVCNNCGLDKKLDLANISQTYKRNTTDWEYLCRSCHMSKDGRINNLKKGRWNNRTYCFCGKQAVTRNGVCMKKYNCIRRHKQPCSEVCQ